MDLLSMVLWTLGLVLVALVAVFYRQRTYWPKRGIPNFDTFPILGMIGVMLFRNKSLAQVVEDLYHGCPGASYYGTMDLNTPLIIIKDPEIIREIGVKSFEYFPNHRSFIDESFDPLLARNIFALKDDRWREMRATLSPSFTANKMKRMLQLVSKCSTDFVEFLRENPEARREFDMKDAYTRYTNDVIATSAFGVSVDSMRDPSNEFYLRGKQAVNFDGVWNGLKFVGARLFPRLMRMLGLTFLNAKTDKFFRKLIRETVRTREEKGIVRPDMIHLLMQARENERGMVMTTDDIIAQAFIFFLAGFDTSSRLMCFVSHLLAHHPDVQERLRREVDTLLAEVEGSATYETLAKMRYMDMVIQETLRLYPPMPLTDRVCGKAYTLPSPTGGTEGVTIEPGTSVSFPIFGLHRDPKYFPEPDRFDPERFNEENRNDISPYTYMPFGLGPRKCIGERFVLMEVKILVAHLLMNFVMKPSTKTTRDITFMKNSFSMTPENGFWMRLETRN